MEIQEECFLAIVTILASFGHHVSTIDIGSIYRKRQAITRVVTKNYTMYKFYTIIQLYMYNCIMYN
jgi:hypothetical protein